MTSSKLSSRRSHPRTPPICIPVKPPTPPPPAWPPATIWLHTELVLDTPDGPYPWTGDGPLERLPTEYEYGGQLGHSGIDWAVWMSIYLPPREIAGNGFGWTPELGSYSCDYGPANLPDPWTDPVDIPTDNLVGLLSATATVRPTP